jgi:hypothetical protein
VNWFKSDFRSLFTIDWETDNWESCCPVWNELSYKVGLKNNRNKVAAQNLVIQTGLLF